MSKRTKEWHTFKEGKNLNHDFICSVKETLPMIEKLKDVLTRNYDSIRINIHKLPKNFGYDLLEIIMTSGFTSYDLNGAFRYWGVDWKYHIFSWSIESNNNISVKVKLYINRNVKCDNNIHDFKHRKDWGDDVHICNKCGLFVEELESEKNKNGIKSEE